MALHKTTRNSDAMIRTLGIAGSAPAFKLEAVCGPAQQRATTHGRAQPRRKSLRTLQDRTCRAERRESVPKPTHGRAQPRRLIKEFEREARTDGLPAEDLAVRKRLLVAELNGYISAKKEAAGALDARRELVADGRVNRAGAEIAPSSARLTGLSLANALSISLFGTPRRMLSCAAGVGWWLAGALPGPAPKTTPAVPAAFRL